jgi:hypothetical protein
VDYPAIRPRLVDKEQAMREAGSAFSPMERLSFRMLGIRQFLLLERTDVT